MDSLDSQYLLRKIEQIYNRQHGRKMVISEKSFGVRKQTAIADAIRRVTIAPTPSSKDVYPLASTVKGAEQSHKEKVIRRLVRKYFKIEKIEMGAETEIKGTTLYIRQDLCKDAIESEDLVPCPKSLFRSFNDLK